MTLVKGSISALNHIDVPSREIALERFHDNWKTNSLVMENWFMWQSSSAVKGTVKKCRELMKHPSFDINNPNKFSIIFHHDFVAPSQILSFWPRFGRLLFNAFFTRAFTVKPKRLKIDPNGQHSTKPTVNSIFLTLHHGGLPPKARP